MLQSAPDALDLTANPANATPTDYWDAARTLSLIGDTLVKLDAQGRPQPALAVAWQSDPSARHWQFTLRRGVKFHDGSAASPAAIAQILGALHPDWNVRASADSAVDRERGDLCLRCSPNSRCRAISCSSAGNDNDNAFPSAPARSSSPSGSRENCSSSPPMKRAGQGVLLWTRSRSSSANRCATRPSRSNSIRPT